MRTHTKTFHIRFTEKEYERLCKHAKKAGLPKTTYIRHMINGCCPKEKPPDEYWKLMRAVYSMGNNLNQLVHSAHRFGSVNAAKLDEINQWLTKMVLALMDRMIVPEKVNVPAVLERGRQLAETEQKAKGEELCEATVGANTQEAKSLWSIRVEN